MVMFMDGSGWWRGLSAWHGLRISRVVRGQPCAPKVAYHYLVLSTFEVLAQVPQTLPGPDRACLAHRVGVGGNLNLRTRRGERGRKTTGHSPGGMFCT